VGGSGDGPSQGVQSFEGITAPQHGGAWGDHEEGECSASLVWTLKTPKRALFEIWGRLQQNRMPATPKTPQYSVAGQTVQAFGVIAGFWTLHTVSTQCPSAHGMMNHEGSRLNGTLFRVLGAATLKVWSLVSRPSRIAKLRKFRLWAPIHSCAQFQSRLWGSLVDCPSTAPCRVV
jgi:hypothetical protein